MQFVIFLLLQSLILINADYLSECKIIRKNDCIFVPKKHVAAFEEHAIKHVDKLMTQDFLKKATDTDISERLKSQTTLTSQKLIEILITHGITYLKEEKLDNCNGRKEFSQESMDKIGKCGRDQLTKLETELNKLIDNLLTEKQLTVFVKTKMNECGRFINQTDIIGPVTGNMDFHATRINIKVFKDLLTPKPVDGCDISEDDIVLLDTIALFSELAVNKYKTDKWEHNLVTIFIEPTAKCIDNISSDILKKDCDTVTKEDS